MLPIEKWFSDELCYWRLLASGFWCFVFMVPVSFVYIFLSNIHTFISPGTLCTGFLSWLTAVFFFTSVQVCFVWLSFSFYTVIPVIYKTRFESILSLFERAKLQCFVQCTAIGLFMAWTSATAVIGNRFSGLTTKQLNESTFAHINEAHLFLMLYGIYLGIITYTNFILNERFLEFPVEQMKKMERLKLEAIPLLNKCLKLTILKMKYFYIFYFCFGKYPRQWICNLFNVTLNPNVRPLDSVLGLLDLQLFWQTLAFGTFANVCWGLGILLIKIYQTEHYTFQIVHITPAGRDRCLNDALSAKDVLLLQYLGFLDVSHLSQFSPWRRSEVFSLSQPGGHAHIWKKLSSACLTNIDKLTAQVELANMKAITALRLKQPFITKDNHLTSAAYTASGTFLHRTGPNISMSLSAPALDKTVSSEETKSKPAWKNKIPLIIKENAILRYFFNELPNAKSHSLFAQAQTSIWAIEGLSYLAAASFVEDQFGVVQLTLPSILTSLLKLHDNVEKYSKLTSSVHHQSHKDQLTSGKGSLRYRLQLTLKTSIHRIVDTFDKHLMNVSLSPECVKILKPFLDPAYGAINAKNIRKYKDNIY